MIIAIYKIWKKEQHQQHKTHTQKKKKKSMYLLNFRIFPRAFPLTKILLIYYSIENVTYLIKYNISIDNDSLSI